MAKITLSFKNKTLKIFPLLEEEIVIGREPACQIYIDSLAVQPMHACVRREADNRYRLIALQDEEPLVIDGQPHDEYILRNGDHFQIGKHTLSFTSDSGTVVAEKIDRPLQQANNGWFQIMNGSNIGRTIRLERALTRVGKTGKRSAMISRRGDGYYISHLEGSKPPKVNGEPIGSRSQVLREGDRVQLGGLELQYFIDGAPLDDGTEASANDAARQRAYTRIAFEAPAVLTQDNLHWDTRLIDVSIKGALIEKPADWAGRIGDACEITAFIASDTTIEMLVEVAHMTDNQVGCHCTRIDVDGIAHLRRIVELNLGNIDLLDRDLAALA
jgi:hypothetical protein